MRNLFFIGWMMYQSVESRFSYLSEGNWTTSSNSLPCEHFLCAGQEKLTWQSSDPNFKYYFTEDACNALVAKGVKVIYFHGDSYMRQMYSAMLITLSGDYRYGSISNSTLFPKCEYHRQFSEKNCGLKELKYNGLTCNGKIMLDPALNGLTDLDRCRNGAVFLWSFGNHKLSRYGRYGINNATAHQLFFENICHQINRLERVITGEVPKHCSVWWVSTHSRLAAFFEDEDPKLVHGFNLGMKDFFEDKKCGNTNYIDVYNMTNDLVINHNEIGKTLSYDYVHWGMEVNLIKAQIILNALIQSPSKVSEKEFTKKEETIIVDQE